MQVTFETRARSAAHFCPFVKPFSEKFVGDFVKNESLSPVFSRDRDSERLSYSLEEVHRGLQACYADLARDVREKYGVPLTEVGALGVSGMMHGYLPFDRDGKEIGRAHV